jgi:integrase
MAMAGIDLPTLKELAGHSQIQMTMRYVHPTPEHKRRAIEKFESANLEPLIARRLAKRSAAALSAGAA